MSVAPDPRGGPERTEDAWHSFTCPVCGHRDRAESGPGGGRATCSHCDTKLVLEAGGPDRERVAASVERSGPDPETPH